MAANLGKLGEVSVELRAELRRLKADFKNAEKRAKVVGDKMKMVINAALAGVSFMAVTKFIGDSVKAFGIQEKAVKRLTVAMQQQGAAISDVNKAIRLTGELQSKTIFGDEESINALATMVNMSGDYTASIKALSLAQDMAVGLGKDLASTSDMLGKAMGGNVDILARYFPAIRDIVPELRNWENVTVLLEERFKGQSQQIAGFTDRVTQLSNELGDLKEKSGRVFFEIVAVGTIEAITHALAAYNKQWTEIFGSKDDADALNKSVKEILEGQKSLVAGSPEERMIGEIAEREIKALQEVKKYQESVLASMIAGPRKVAGWEKVNDALLKTTNSIYDMHQQVEQVYKVLGSSTAPIKEMTKAEKDLAEKTEANALALKSFNDERDRQAQILETLKNGMPIADADTAVDIMPDVKISTWENLQIRAIESVEGVGLAAAASLASAFAGWAMDTKKNIGEVAIEFSNRILGLIAELTAKLALFQLANVLLPGSGFVAAMGSSFFGSAQGNVFNGGNVQPFAFGGIVDRPTAFPMGGGKTGLMGEAGMEAIMPLSRNAQGDLGVKTDGGFSPVINITLDGREIRHSVQRGDRFDMERGI